MRRRIVQWLRRLLEIDSRDIRYLPKTNTYLINGIHYEEYIFRVIQDAAVKGRAFQFRYDPVRNLIFMKESLLIGSDYLIQVPELN
jgi:hypothetical protein